jgi:hypothetical protein
MSAKKSPTLQIMSALERIVKTIAESGGEVTRTAITRTLGMDLAVFDEAAQYGCESKILKCGTYNKYKALKEYAIPEEGYYDAVEESIRKLWLSEGYKDHEFYLENTSRKDSKIEGPWTRPDLTLVSYKKFPWTIGHEFDVVTYEVKKPSTANVLAVFEALAHVTAATRAYAVFPVSLAAWTKDNPAQERRVRDECSKH